MVSACDGWEKIQPEISIDKKILLNIVFFNKLL